MKLRRTPIAYRYDGTLNGLLSCIFTCFESRYLPEALLGPNAAQTVLYPVTAIHTDPAKAQRVAKGICGKISEELLEMVEDALLCEGEGVDMAAMEVVCLGFEVGPGVVDQLTEPCVDRLMKALRFAWGEAHLITGFVRFREFGGALISTIAPKNRVLGLIAPHFADRFAKETFMIYDEVHKEALVHQCGLTGIYPVEHHQPPPASDPELQITSLWQQYFKAVSIQSRENPICQRSHIPKRYWAHMVEMQPDVCYNVETKQVQALEGPS